MVDFIELMSREDDETVMINIKNITFIRRSTQPRTKCDIYTNNGIIRTNSSYKEIKAMLEGLSERD